MTTEAEARKRFSELMSAPEEQVALDRAVLVIALGEYPDLDVDGYLDRLDDMATEVRPRLSPEEAPERRIALLNAYIFGEQAFRGNVGNYYDPRNSYLNDVLDRRTGIPITLSALYIEVARRLGLRIDGVGMPGHFIVRCRDATEELLIDPFNRGAVLTVDDCAERLRELYGNSLPFRPELLRSAGKREIIRRILGNLKGCYLRIGDGPRALRAVEWARSADPSHPEDLREQGLLRWRGGDVRGAIADLEHFLEQQPDGRLADETREQLRLVQDQWSRRNCSRGLPGYGAAAVEHYRRPRNVGRLDGANAVGTVDDRATENLITIYLRIEAGRVVAASFRTLGCSACIASSSILSELVHGQTLAQAALLDAATIEAALGGLPAAKRHCAELAARALARALASASARL